MRLRLDLAGFGVLVTLHADRLAGAFAGTGVGAGTLTANGEAATMADATVAVDRLKALEILLQFAAQITFDGVLVFLNDLDDAVELLVGQAFRANVGADSGVRTRRAAGLRAAL